MNKFTDKQKTTIIEKTLPYYKAFNTAMGMNAYQARELYWYGERYDAVALGKSPWVKCEDNVRRNVIEFVGFEFKVSKQDLNRMLKKDNYGSVFNKFILVVWKDMKDYALEFIKNNFPHWGLWVCLSDKGNYRYVKQPDETLEENTYPADVLYRFMMARRREQPQIAEWLDAKYVESLREKNRKDYKTWLELLSKKEEEVIKLKEQLKEKNNE